MAPFPAPSWSSARPTPPPTEPPGCLEGGGPQGQGETGRAQPVPLTRGLGAKCTKPPSWGQFATQQQRDSTPMTRRKEVPFSSPRDVNGAGQW